MKTKTNLSILTAVTIVGGMLSVAPAQASVFGGSTTLNPAFCTAHNLRQTVIYVDDSILVKGENEWIKELHTKLKATLSPGERTTLVQLSPISGQSKELWSGCWPAYSDAQTAKLAHQTSFFSGDPLAGLKDQQGFFFRDLGIAAAKMVEHSARPAASVTVDATNPPKKDILRALTSDADRFAHAHETIRAILYSDLAENSDLGSVFATPQPKVDDLGARLGTYLRRSVFYIYGLGKDVHGDTTYQDGIKRFWMTGLQSMAANIGGIGTDLNMPNSLPVKAYDYDVTVNEDGNELHGRLSLLVDSDNGLVDSWLGITRLRTAAINGTMRCPSAETCTLDATTSGGIVTTSASETLSLKSNGGSGLAGTIGVPGSAVNLKVTATQATD